MKLWVVLHLLKCRHPRVPTQLPLISTRRSPSKTCSDEVKTGLALDLLYVATDDNAVTPPQDILELVEQLWQPRQNPYNDTTPNSKTVAALKTASERRINETTEMFALVESMIYPVKVHPEHQVKNPVPWITAQFNQQWTANISKPAEFKNNKAWQDAWKKSGIPPIPKPDVCYGYDKGPFSYDQSLAIRALPKDIVTHADMPWFPYMMVQWHSAKKTAETMQLHRRKDGSTGSDLMHRFFTYQEPHRPVSAKESCVFTLIFAKESVVYRIHWRHSSPDRSRVSYQSLVVEGGFFHDEHKIYDTRTAVLNTLKWVREERLQAIRKKLSSINEGNPQRLQLHLDDNFKMLVPGSPPQPPYWTPHPMSPASHIPQSSHSSTSNFHYSSQLLNQAATTHVRQQSSYAGHPSPSTPTPRSRITPNAAPWQMQSAYWPCSPQSSSQAMPIPASPYQEHPQRSFMFISQHQQQLYSGSHPTPHSQTPQQSYNAHNPSFATPPHSSFQYPSNPSTPAHGQQQNVPYQSQPQNPSHYAYPGSQYPQSPQGTQSPCLTQHYHPSYGVYGQQQANNNRGGPSPPWAIFPAFSSSTRSSPMSSQYSSASSIATSSNAPLSRATAKYPIKRARVPSKEPDTSLQGENDFWGISKQWWRGTVYGSFYCRILECANSKKSVLQEW